MDKDGMKPVVGMLVPILLMAVMVMVGCVSANTVSESGLACGSTYRFRVSGLRRNASRDSAASSIYSFTSVSTECGDAPPPTITDQSPTFGSKTIRDMALTVGTSINKTLPDASGGNGTLKYSISPTMLPRGLAFNKRTRTLSGTPTAVQEAVSYTYKVTDTDSGSNLPNDTDTLNFTIAVNLQDCPPGARCTSPPTETPSNGGFPDTTHLQATALNFLDPITELTVWRMLGYKTVGVKVTTTDDWTIPSHYSFLLRVNTDETGLQVTTNNECDFSPVPRNSVEWRKRNEFDLSGTFGTATVIRCGKGSASNAGLDLVVVDTRTPNKTAYKDIVNDIMMAPHLENDNGNMTYHLNKAAMPSGSSLREDDAYETGGEFWNDILGNVSFSETANESAARIKIQGALLPSLPCDDDTAVACVRSSTVLKTMSNGKKKRVYVEPFNMFIVNYPLDGKVWTHLYGDYEDRLGERLYLPHLIGHEFGHTMGLKDHKVRKTLMYYAVSEWIYQRDMPPCTTKARNNDACDKHQYDIDSLKGLLAWTD